MSVTYMISTRKITYARYISSTVSLSPSEVDTLNRGYLSGHVELIASGVVVGNYPNGADAKEPVNALLKSGTCYYFAYLERTGT